MTDTDAVRRRAVLGLLAAAGLVAARPAVAAAATSFSLEAELHNLQETVGRIWTATPLARFGLLNFAAQLRFARIQTAPRGYEKQPRFAEASLHALVALDGIMVKFREPPPVLPLQSDFLTFVSDAFAKNQETIDHVIGVVREVRGIFGVLTREEILRYQLVIAALLDRYAADAWKEASGATFVYPFC